MKEADVSTGSTSPRGNRHPKRVRRRNEDWQGQVRVVMEHESRASYHMHIRKPWRLAMVKVA
jgi:hypothetical protein